ncbi:MAG: DivIVA domain-containing protein [Spirosomataceae bacterium]
MKITPIEIRQQTFERVFRGYEKETVDAFLNSLSQEWEKVQDELKMLKMQLELSEREVNRMKDLETTMFKTLKSAEDTREQVAREATEAAEQKVSEANQEANRITQDAQNTADQVLKEAQKKANMLLVDAESKAKFILEDALNEMKSMERDFKAMERYKEHLTSEIRRYANDTLERVARFEEKFAKQTYESKVGELQEAIKSVIEPAPVVEPETAVPAPEPVSVESPVETDLPADDESDELPTLSEIMKKETNELLSDSDEHKSAADEIQDLLKSVKKNKKKPVDTPPAEETDGGSFFDKI